MTPAERAQAGALLASAEAMHQQAQAVMHLAEAQINALHALLGAEPPSAEAQAAREKIFGTGEGETRTRHYGSAARKAREDAERLATEGEQGDTQS